MEPHEQADRYIAELRAEIARLRAGIIKELDRWDEDLTLKEFKNAFQVLKE